jgi:hypothetical protein
MGFVYLLECSDNDSTKYKIGYTKHEKIPKRISGLQTGNSEEIRELYKFQTKYDQKLEVVLHNQYSYCRCKKGEWFNLDYKSVANFINTCEKIEKNFDSLKDNPFFKV